MPSDLPALAAIYGDGETMRYIGKGYPNGLPPQRAGPALEKMAERYEREGIGIWPVVRKEDGRVIGACGLQRLPSGTDVEIAFLFARDFWGHGYAFEAAGAVLAFGFRDQRLPRIVAVANKFNARSITLIHRLGMHFVGVVRAYQSDLLLYAKEAPA